MRLAGFGLRRPEAPNPGRGLAGTAGSAGQEVTGFKPGDEVYGTCDGSFAPYARARAGRLAPKPANLSFAQAAAVPVSALTALQAVRDRAQVQAGQKVLIIGVSGGVGTFAVQIAKAFGAEVTGVCSTAKTDLVRAIGADRVVDYTREDFADGQHRYDVILDIGGTSRLSHLRRALTPRGRLVMVGGESGGRWLGGMDRLLRALLLFPLVSQKLSTFIASENSADLKILQDLIESGKIAPPSTGPTRSARPRPLSGTSRKAEPAARSSSPSDGVPVVNRGLPRHRRPARRRTAPRRSRCRETMSGKLCRLATLASPFTLQSGA